MSGTEQIGPGGCAGRWDPSRAGWLDGYRPAAGPGALSLGEALAPPQAPPVHLVLGVVPIFPRHALGETKAETC